MNFSDKINDTLIVRCRHFQRRLSQKKQWIM